MIQNIVGTKSRLMKQGFEINGSVFSELQYSAERANGHGVLAGSPMRELSNLSRHSETSFPIIFIARGKYSVRNLDFAPFAATQNKT